MKYKTISAANPQELDDKVADFMSRGWTVCGGPYQMQNAVHQCIVLDESAVEYSYGGSGITPDAVATLALLSSLHRGGRR